MGGLVARSVPLLHPETRLHVHNLITLATPHAGLPFGLDESIRQFYNLLNEKEREHPLLTTVSISGGIRDEMMPPEVCFIENDKTMSVSKHYLFFAVAYTVVTLFLMVNNVSSFVYSYLPVIS